jgi:hypothetical protein
MKYLLSIVILAFALSLHAQELININPDPNAEPWYVGGFRELSADEIEKIPEYIPEYNHKREVLPYRVDNSLQKYFRGVILQTGGSCSQASGIGYIYTYEVNRLRDLAADDSTRQFPPQFTYNFLNKGSNDNGSNYTDGWQILKENGCPTLKEYGGLYPNEETYWMSGYDKYYTAMKNRVVNYYRLKVNTPEGLNSLKEYLAHHGDGSASGGLVNFSAGAASAKSRPLALGGYEERRRIIIEWSDPVDHAMTFVGYDDSVRYDFNNDDQFTNDIDITGDGMVDMRDWEIGAMILVNTWSEQWGDSGRAYTPYRNLALAVSEGGISNGQVYIVMPEVQKIQPEMTLRLKIQHEKRNKLQFKVGIAEYILDTLPEYEITPLQLNKRGGPYSMNGVDSLPLEFGLDISSLLHIEGIDAAKFFLCISEDDKDTTADGKLLEWSIIDYRNNGKEYKSADTLVDIVNNGLTISSIIINATTWPPTQLNAEELTSSTLLTWQKPEKTDGLSGYIVLRDGEVYQQCSDTFFSDELVPNGTKYKVKALYGSQESSPSNTVVISNDMYLPVAGSGYSLKYDGTNDCVNCGDGIDISSHDFTIEFWAKRNPESGNQFVIGGGKYNKGHHGLHIGFRNNKLMCGFWGDDVHTDEVYTDSAWHHWTITFDTATNTQRIYRDGVIAGERVSDEDYLGTGNLYIGCMKGSTWWYRGELDEVRIWNYVRSEDQIIQNMYLPLQGNEAGLLGYWNFDERSGSILNDVSDSGNAGTLNGFSNKAWMKSTAWQNRSLLVEKDSIEIFSGYSKTDQYVECAITVQPQYGNVIIDSIHQRIWYVHSQNFSGTDQFQFSMTENGLSSLYLIEVNANLLHAMEKEYVQEIRVYPNPFTDRLFIEHVNDSQSIRLINMEGKTLLYKHVQPHQYSLEIDTKHLSKGIYSVILQSNTEIQVARLIKAD